MITAGVIPDTRHRLIGREIDIIRCRIEETSIPIGDTSDMIDGTGDETRDTTVILAAIKQVTHSGRAPEPNSGQALSRLMAVVAGRYD